MNIIETENDGYFEFSIKNKAKLCFSIFHEYEEYFDQDLNPQDRIEFFKLTKYEPIIYLEHLEVKPEFQNQGLSSKLMDHFISYVKNNKFEFIYLNASPCQDKRLELNDLTDFYKRKGFNVFKDQGNNRLMIKKIEL